MAPKAYPKKPTQDEYTKMICGPKVDVYVGAAKKHYTLPKLLLCHYSDYFQRLFSSKCIGGQSQTLNLLKDNAGDFSILLEYMLHGNMPPALAMPKAATPKKCLDRCMAFLEYAGKYNLGAVGDIICKPLQKAVNSDNKDAAKIESNHIELVFRIAAADNPLRPLIVRTAMATLGIDRCFATFQKQLQEVPGFAFELLKKVVCSR